MDTVTITAYVNAYAVTRHYGGPEEGGWWYNRGEPLASVPIRAFAILHPVRYREGDDCPKCGIGGWSKLPDNRAAIGTCADGCDAHEGVALMWHCGACGHTWDYEESCAGCEGGRNPNCPDNEISYNEDDARLATAWLEHQLAGTNEGNIYSARGGVELQIRKEAVQAYRWPEGRPHYE